MNLVAHFNSSVASAPGWYKDAVNAVVQIFNANFTNSITVNINFGWGEVNGHPVTGGLAASQRTSDFYDYATLKNALSQGSPVSQTGAASMPQADPTNGGAFRVPIAMEKVIGLFNPGVHQGQPDGWVGLNSGSDWNPNINAPPGSGQYDPIGELKHEITEVMGRIGFLGMQRNGQGQAIYGPMDLYRFSDPGRRVVTPVPGWFSVTGNQLLQQYNDPQNGGDVADWANGVRGDAFGNGYPGLTGAFTQPDLTVMRALGYVVSSGIVNG